MSTVHTLSHFLRRSGDVLDALDDGDVVLRRRDGEDVVLTTVARDEAVGEACRLLAGALAEALEDEAARPLLTDAAARSAPWLGLVDRDERAGILLRVARGLLVREELDATGPLVRALEDARRRARLGADRRGWTRPVAVPDDLGGDPAAGVVELPLHIRWSTPPRRYDLDDPGDLRRAYEQVLREGTEEDVRRFVDPDRLREVWDDLVLPRHVRAAWAASLDAD